VSAPELIVKRDILRQRLLEYRKRAAKIGLVPTMGALHAGHLSLVQASAAECDSTVVSIFVNPIQFGAHEDFSRYPRNLEADLAQLELCGANLVFAPQVDHIYGPEHSTFVQPPRVAEPLEGEYRPDHFRGVATIVVKLLNLVGPDLAFFGQKDYQQALVIRHVVQELDIPVSIRVCPTVREADGLAMSSRNAYLSPAERQQALALSASLRQAVAMFRDGETRADRIQAAMHQTLRDAGIRKVDYATLADPTTLAPVATANRRTMALVAAHVGSTRLIDNAQLG
jgi:pantoate--beta-alanine ligase